MKQLPRILVIGTRTAFGSILAALERLECYQFDYARDPESARPLLAHKPDSILLQWPTEPEASDQGLAWLRSFRDETTVVVVSSQPDIAWYLSIMEYGAFDYLTSESPLEEVTRVLDNAVRWGSRRAA